MYALKFILIIKPCQQIAGFLFLEDVYVHFTETFFICFKFFCVTIAIEKILCIIVLGLSLLII